MTRSVPVGLGERAYEVVVGSGLIDSAGKRIAPLLKRARTAVVTDQSGQRPSTFESMIPNWIDAGVRKPAAM